MRKIIFICLFYLLLLSCYDNSNIVNLAIKQERSLLVERGWLSEAFLDIDIISGEEIHNIDSNIVWGYFESNDLNVKEECKKSPFGELNYSTPPREIRSNWINRNQFNSSIKYQCLEFGGKFVFLHVNNIIYFTTI